MKFSLVSFLVVFILHGNSIPQFQEGNIEFVCFRKQAAAKQCHYNFKVDGAKYRYVDIGCRFVKKEEVIEKVKDGSLGLARDWKVECGEVKEKPADSDNKI